MRDHRKLKVFHKAHELVLVLYKSTSSFPKDERYGLTTQMRRAAVSIPSNLVEGCARATEKEYLRFIDIAYGSASELRYQLRLSSDLGYLDHADNEILSEQCSHVARMLGSMLRTLRKPKEPKRSK